MKLLITGGCGFIGSNIAEYFLENSFFESIIIIDNLSTGFMQNIQNLLDKHNSQLDHLLLTPGTVETAVDLQKADVELLITVR